MAFWYVLSCKPGSYRTGAVVEDDRRVVQCVSHLDSWSKGGETQSSLVLYLVYLVPQADDSLRRVAYALKPRRSPAQDGAVPETAPSSVDANDRGVLVVQGIRHELSSLSAGHFSWTVDRQQMGDDSGLAMADTVMSARY